MISQNEIRSTGWHPLARGTHSSRALLSTPKAWGLGLTQGCLLVPLRPAHSQCPPARGVSFYHAGLTAVAATLRLQFAQTVTPSQPPHHFHTHLRVHFPQPHPPSLTPPAQA